MAPKIKRKCHTKAYKVLVYIHIPTSSKHIIPTAELK